MPGDKAVRALRRVASGATAGWKAIYDRVNEMAAEEVAKRKTTQALVTGGIPAEAAVVISRLELVNAHAISAVAEGFETEIAAAGALLQRNFQKETNQLTVELGRVWDAMPRHGGKLGTVIAASWLGRRLGLPLPAPALPATAPTSAADPHATARTGATGLTIAPALGTAGFKAEFLPDFPNTDYSGIVRLTNTGSAYVFSTLTVTDMFTLTYNEPFNNRPVASAYFEDSGDASTAVGVGDLVAKSGGSKTAVTFQGILFLNNPVAASDGKLLISYNITPRVGG